MCKENESLVPRMTFNSKRFAYTAVTGLFVFGGSLGMAMALRDDNPTLSLVSVVIAYLAAMTVVVAPYTPFMFSRK